MPTNRPNLAELLEPNSAATCYSDIAPLVSIAISLRRIADMLERESAFQTAADLEQSTKPPLIR